MASKTQKTMGFEVQVGDLVGAGRWPMTGGNFHGRPWAGVLLADNDPRAWEGSIAFGPGPPTQEAVDAHIAWCRATLPKSFDETRPVMWDFGPHGTKVYWDRASGIVPYAEDVRACDEANAARRAEWSGLKLHVA